MKSLRTIFGLFLLAFLFLSPLYAEDLQLTSEKMRYDSETGAFAAEENVKVVRGTLTATSNNADGNMNEQKFRMIGSVHVFGTWAEEKVDMKGEVLAGEFADPQGYSFEGNVKGSWGPRTIDADRIGMKGDRFFGSNVRRYEDSREGYLLRCNSLEGTLSNGEVEDFTAVGSVYFLSRPAKGEPTEIRGQRAVYSKSRGSLVISGNVTAMQAARSLKSDTIVYFPQQNRVEASGRPQLIFKLDDDKKEEKKEEKPKK